MSTRRWTALAWLLAILLAGGCGGEEPEARAPTAGDPEAHSSPRGWIALVVETDSGPSIVVRELSRSAVRVSRIPPIPGPAGYITSLAWDRQGTRLAFSDSAQRIFVLDVESFRVRRLSTPPVEPAQTVSVEDWSPDGTRLAVSSVGDGCAAGEPSLHVVPVTDGRSRRLPAHPPQAPPASGERPAAIDAVSWSPDSSSLLYIWRQFENGDCRSVSAREALFEVDADGRRSRALFRADFLGDARWSPNGRRIVARSGCGANEPLGWTPGREGDLLVATSYDGCTVSVLDGHGNVEDEFDLFPSKHFEPPTAVLYRLDTASGRAVIVRSFGDVVEMLGSSARGSLVGALGKRLLLISEGGRRVQWLPAVQPPRGMRAGRAEAAVLD